jgi:predicted secreted protein
MYRPFFIGGNMFGTVRAALMVMALGFAVTAHAETLVIVPAFGETTLANDEAYATFMVEEQDPDKNAASSRVNQKMKQGIEAIKREDPQAVLKTNGYFTYAVYPEMTQRQPNKKLEPIGWRVGQQLSVITTNLVALKKTVATGQRLMALKGLYFGLSKSAVRLVDEQRIAATYANLTERIAFIARAMNRNPSDALIDTVDFEGSGAYAAQKPQAAAAAGVMALRGAQDPAQVEEPSFEPGQTTLNMRVVARVKFK